MRLVPFTPSDLAGIEPWFDDEPTRRYLGGREWPRELLALAGRPIAGVVERLAWLAVEDGSAVALADVEIYGDGSASTAIVVDPARRRAGRGVELLALVAADARGRGVRRLVGGVHSGNEASARCARRAGFVPLSERPDADGFTDHVLDL